MRLCVSELALSPSEHPAGASSTTRTESVGDVILSTAELPSMVAVNTTVYEASPDLTTNPARKQKN